MNKFILLASFICSLSTAQAQDTTVPGTIMTLNNDTIPCSIIKLSKRKDEERARYKELQILDSAGAVKKVMPEAIHGYMKDDVVFKSINLPSGHIFAKLITDGSVTLYHYPGVDGEIEKHFFRRKGEKDLTVFDNNSGIVKSSQYFPGTEKYSYNNFYIKQRSQQFILYFSKYFEDCTALVSKIKSEFYTASELQDIFSEYNRCKLK